MIHDPRRLAATAASVVSLALSQDPGRLAAQEPAFDRDRAFIANERVFEPSPGHEMPTWSRCLASWKPVSSSPTPGCSSCSATMALWRC